MCVYVCCFFGGGRKLNIRDITRGNMFVYECLRILKADCERDRHKPWRGGLYSASPEATPALVSVR